MPVNEEESQRKTETLRIEGDPNKIPIDIIVISHSRWELTKLCVDSLYLYTPNPFHLIIIDDSNDLTTLHLTDLQNQHDNLTLIHSDVPYKCGNQIFNIALANCKYDYVATVMNSITVKPEWTIGPLLILMGQPDAATVGLKTLFSDGTPYSGQIESAGIEIHTFMDYAGVKVAGYTPVDIGAHFNADLLPLNYERPAVQWAFALHRKKALIGNLAEDIYHGFVGWDDIDNCFVLRKKGYKIFYSGSGIGVHFPRATRGVADGDERQKLNKENGEIFRKRWGLEVEKSPPPMNRAERRRAEREKVA